MLGASLHFGRGHGEDRFYNAAKARRNPNHNPFRPRSFSSASAAGGGGDASSAPGTVGKGKALVSDGLEPENRAGSQVPPKPMAVPSSSSGPPAPLPHCNLDRFLEATTPSVPAQYLSKTRMRGWRTCDVEFRPYFALEDLWESFKEWSAYGAGVPLLLNDSDLVVQYYVPYLSGIQLYVEHDRHSESFRQFIEESDGNSSRDSSSDGGSDSAHEQVLKFTRDWSRKHFGGVPGLGIDKLSLRGNRAVSQEEFSSDDSDAGNAWGQLLFEYLEHNPPYSREPLADKISDLARCFPELKTLRSCDLLPTSWISVAWYPIYRIPTGPTLRDLDACFLTYHSLSTPMKGSGDAPGPLLTHPQRADGAPKISIPSFGLSSYKLKGSIWTANGGYERQLANSLLQSAENWLRLRQVNHPDYQFFASHGATCR